MDYFCLYYPLLDQQNNYRWTERHAGIILYSNRASEYRPGLIIWCS